VAVFFGLANYSYSFYILRANDVGILIAFIPLIYLVYNIFYAFSAYPAGQFSDRVGRRPVLITAFIMFALLNIAFAYWATSFSLWILFAFYGLFIGLTDGVLKAFVSDLAAKENQGEAFGIYHTIIGLTALIGNLGAGFLWQTWGARIPFLASSVLIVIGAMILWLGFSDHESVKTDNHVSRFKGYRG
jgi:MFS family permease